jgi:hypothetical protein
MTQPKKIIGVLFECCHVYHRIYINKEKTLAKVDAPSVVLR